MPIIDIDKVKSLIGMDNVDTYDNQIADLIPVVQDWLVGDLNNYFHLDFYYQAATIAFTEEAITDSADGFSIAGFYELMDIHVQGKSVNEGIYAIDGLADGQMDLSAEAEDIIFEPEDAGETITLTRVRFPFAMQRPFAKLIQFDLIKKNPGVTSFSLADYSEDYAGEGDYPPDLMKKFDQWRKLKFRRGS